jgi:hypothetical protein
MHRSNGQRDGRWNQKGCLSIIREMEKQMTDRETQPSVAERTADSFTDAQRTVEAAVEDVRQTGRHVKRAIRSADRSTSVGILRQATRIAPVTMLLVAFAAGAFLFSGKRY